MSILTGNGIKEAIKQGHITIDGFDENSLQPNSYDVHLGTKVGYYVIPETNYIEADCPDQINEVEIPEYGYLLQPNKLYLLSTKEIFWSDVFVSEISGISSLARKGVSVHKTAGYANLGHKFSWILEVDVVYPFLIRPGMRIGQVYFHTVAGNTSMQYNGIYSNLQLSDKIVGSQLHNIVKK